MSTTFSTAPAFDLLRPQIQKAERLASVLVIAHDDTELLRGLTPVLADRTAVILKAAQQAWDFQHPEFIGSIENAFDEGDIKSVLLIGHSQVAAESCDKSSEKPEPTERQFSTLIAGVQRTMSINRAAEKEFADQAKSLCQVPAIRQRLSEGSLVINALLFRAESGASVRYAFDSGKFEPMLK